MSNWSSLFACITLSVAATPAVLAQSYATVKWNNPRVPAKEDVAFCFQTGSPIQPKTFSNDPSTVLRFTFSTETKTPFDYTVSFEGKILVSGSGGPKPGMYSFFDNAYVKEPIKENSTYRFVLHLEPHVILSAASVDANTNAIRIVGCK